MKYLFIILVTISTNAFAIPLSPGMQRYIEEQGVIFEQNQFRNEMMKQNEKLAEKNLLLAKAIITLQNQVKDHEMRLRELEKNR